MAGEAAGNGRDNVVLAALADPNNSLVRMPAAELVREAKLPEGIPTGFGEWDSRSGGGFCRGSLVLLGAPTGSAKTITAMAMARRQVMAGYRVLFVSLEMTWGQMRRIFLAGIRVADGDLARMEVWQGMVKGNGGDLVMVHDKPWSSVEPALVKLAAAGEKPVDVIYVDHVGLTHSSADPDQWRNITGSIETLRNKVAVPMEAVAVVTCQLQKGGAGGGRLRYANRIGDPADIFWSWGSPKGLRRKKNIGKVDVKVVKNRQASEVEDIKPFGLEINFSSKWVRAVDAGDNLTAKAQARADRNAEIERLSGEGLKMQDIAESVGCSIGTVSNVMRGKGSRKK